MNGSPNLRSWLAELLSGRPVAGWPAACDELAAVDSARDEGVVSLVHQQLFSGPCAGACPPPLLAVFADAARVQAAMGLAHTSECRRVVDLLGQAGIPCLLLKGSALGAWLYPTSYLRECGDIDLLLRSRADVERALDILTTMGFSAPARTIPGDLVSYELMCFDASQGHSRLEVDLHWKLCNASLFSDSLGWTELHEGAVPLPSLGAFAAGLSPVHALIHACLHRAVDLQFGDGNSNRLRWLYDLKLLAESLDHGQWLQLCLLARHRGIAGVCAHGLEAAHRELRVVLPEEVLASLADAARGERIDPARLHRWLYAQWVTGGSLPNWRSRLRWFRQRFLPDPAYLRELHRADRYGLPRILWIRFTRGIGRICAVFRRRDGVE